MSKLLSVVIISLLGITSLSGCSTRNSSIGSANPSGGITNSITRHSYSGVTPQVSAIVEAIKKGILGVAPQESEVYTILHNTATSVAGGEFMVVNFPRANKYAVFYLWIQNSKWKAANCGNFTTNVNGVSGQFGGSLTHGTVSNSNLGSLYTYSEPDTKYVTATVGAVTEKFDKINGLPIWVIVYPSTATISKVVGYDAENNKVWTLIGS